MVYEVNNGKIIHSEYRENTLEQHDDEAEHSHVQIIELLRDVDILLVAAIGKHMKNDVEKSSMNYQMVQEEKLTQIIENFLKSNKYE
jgi:predicted Fe-Mo cluster-binding NifX family protein